jgi:hypothetical protein
MSSDAFENDCPGCRPALLDVKTGKTFAADTPEMKVINCVWSGTTKGERQAFHAFTCQNSRALHHIAIVKAITDKIDDGLRKLRQS